MRNLNTKLSRSQYRNEIAGWLFSMPAILGFLVYVIGPMIASLFFSMTDYSVFNPKITFLGLENYQILLSNKDPFFYKSLVITFYYVILNTPCCIAFSFAIAMLLNNELKFRAIFRSIFYLPSVVPSVAVCVVWLWLMNPDVGLLNQILETIGLPKSMWLFSEKTVIPSLVFTNLWGTGSTMVIFLAGLQNIPNQYYEALDIDGGNWWHKLTYVTIPMMTPTIFFNTIMSIINGFQAFDKAYILTEGGPNNGSLFYVYLLWREAFRNFRFGHASALAWILFLIILLFTVIIFKYSGWVYYEGGDNR